MSGYVHGASRAKAAEVTVSNARVEAAGIIRHAEHQAAAIIRRAHTHANRIENSAREYAAALNPDRPAADPSLYQTLMNERYGRKKVMSLYYQDDHVTLYHGDCLTERREWLDADVLVTDPPYGMSYTGFGGRKGEPRRATGKLSVAGDGDVLIRDAALNAWGDRPAIAFGKWSVERPAATRQVIIWDKSDNGPGMGAIDLPWGPSFEEAYVMGKGFVGKRESSVYRVKPYTSGDSDRPDHPTPKPIGLMTLLVEKCPPGTIADPFAGSGSTLLAAKNLGRKVIGVELEERYAEICAKRLSQEVFQF